MADETPFGLLTGIMPQRFAHKSYRRQGSTLRAWRISWPQGTVTLAQIMAYCASLGDDVDLDQVKVNGGSITWEREATPEEIAEEEAHQASIVERQTAYRLKAMQEYAAEFGYALTNGAHDGE